MLSIPTLIDAVLNALRSNPDLIQDVTDEDAIYSFTSRSDLYKNADEAINSMATPSVMVVYNGVRMGAESDFPRWVHSFDIYLKADNCDALYAMLGHLFNPANNLPAFVETDIVPECFPPADIEAEKVTDADDNELFRVRFALTEIGG